MQPRQLQPDHSAVLISLASCGLNTLTARIRRGWWHLVKSKWTGADFPTYFGNKHISQQSSIQSVQLQIQSSLFVNKAACRFYVSVTSFRFCQVTPSNVLLIPTCLFQATIRQSSRLVALFFNGSAFGEIPFFRSCAKSPIRNR